MPLWKLGLLERSQAAIQAQDMLRAALVARMAGAKSEHFRRFVRELERQAQPVRAQARKEVLFVTRTHAAWFEAQGIPHQVVD